MVKQSLPIRIAWLGLIAGIGGVLGRPPAIAKAQGLPQGSWESWTVEWRGQAHEVRVYRPAGFPAHRPYPVIYLLSGWAMGLGMWERPDLQQAADAAHILLVALQGEEDGVPSYYSIYPGLPWPGGSAWQVSFYDWFFQGVLPWVESRYPVRRDPGGRALVGFSMGGKGAFSLAAHRPDFFAAAVSIGGVLDLTLHDSEALRAVYGPKNADPLRYAADNPIELAPNLKGLTLMIFHGAADPEVSPVHSRRMHEVLQALGYPHYWEEIPGLGHEVSSAEIGRIFETLSPILRAPYRPPDRWSYRFTMARARTIYGMRVSKTDPATWTELRDVTPRGFEVHSGDSITLITPPWYSSRIPLRVQIWKERSNIVVSERRMTAPGGRLRLTLPAGRWRLTVEAIPRTSSGGVLIPSEGPLLASSMRSDPVHPLRRKPLCPENDPICYRF
ncbi:alpha/beta hydrolase [Thermoflexus sp.]|uniref:alpha/beta hydrolase n=1 Tax=Thermoflexus sp. TaxID=1969742 RepID=UPI002ADE2F81|nr:alpha/beta hydrolase-fold protein [Thermoflexus sp.]